MPQIFAKELTGFGLWLSTAAQPPLKRASVAEVAACLKGIFLKLHH
jgi:hypothetical protein